MVTIFHNPRCSKSRGALQILQEHFSTAEIKEVRYLDTPPTLQDLQEITEKLQTKPAELLRTGEALFKELGLTKKDDRSDHEWLRIMIENPRLIERPIIVIGNKAVIARPPEKVLDIIG